MSGTLRRRLLAWLVAAGLLGITSVGFMVAGPRGRLASMLAGMTVTPGVGADPDVHRAGQRGPPEHRMPGPAAAPPPFDLTFP